MGDRITDSAISKAKPKAEPYEVSFEYGIILRVQPTGYKSLYCQHGRGQRTRLGKAGVITLKQAEYKARELLNEVADFGSAVKRGLTKGTLDGFTENVYTPWVNANRRRAEKTLGDLERCFAKLGDRPLTSITRDDLDRYVSDRVEAGVTGATICRELNILQGLMRLAVEKNYLRETPFKGWKKPRADDIGVTRYLSAAEETRLRKALRDRDEKARRERKSANAWRTARGYKLMPEIAPDAFSDHLAPMVILSLGTGMRYGEVAKLEWPALDLTARTVTVTGATSKGMKTANIPLNEDVTDALKRWKASGSGRGLVFPSTSANADDEEPIGTVKTAWGSLLAAAKIEQFRWHDMRHTFASRLVQRGVDLAVVRMLMRHSDFRQTLRYAHHAPHAGIDAVAKLSP